jgi:hypothetical protein
MINTIKPLVHARPSTCRRHREKTQMIVQREFRFHVSKSFHEGNNCQRTCAGKWVGVGADGLLDDVGELLEGGTLARGKKGVRKVEEFSKEESNSGLKRKLINFDFLKISRIFN